MTISSVLQRLADLRIATVLLLVFAIETLVGTLLQAKIGIWGAQQLLFHNWFGVPLIGALAIVNLLCALCVRIRWKRHNTGLILLHIGLLSLLFSAGVGSLTSQSGSIELVPGQASERATHNTDWELVFEVFSDTGISSWSQDLAKMQTGKSLDFGPFAPDIFVKVILSNGTKGPGKSIIAIRKQQNPEEWTPAVLLHNDSVLTVAKSSWFVNSQQRLTLQRKGFKLPCRITLKSFQRSYHPGTAMASAYQSTLLVNENGATREVRISMNQPLRMGDYTFYQSSWSNDPTTGQDHSILAVTRSPLRNGPYAATLLIGLGLFLHVVFLFYRGKRSSSTVPLTALFIAFFTLQQTVHAQTNVPLQVPAMLMQLPIQVDGRVKPLETYAQQLLVQISGKSTIHWKSPQGEVIKLDARQWLGKLLLGENMDSLPIFLIENPETRDALGLEGKERDRYSWNQIMPVGLRLNNFATIAQGFAPKDRSSLHRDVLRVADSWNRYYSILHALDFDRKHNILLPYTSFLDFARHSQSIRPHVDSLLSQHPDSVDVNGRAYLAWVDASLASADPWAETEFAVSPVMQGSTFTWTSPGPELLRAGLDNTDFAEQMGIWSRLREAWANGKQDSLNLQAGLLYDTVTHFAGNHNLRVRALQAEHIYNRIDPFYRALLLYFFMLIPAFFAIRSNKSWLVKMAALFGFGALALQGIGIALRMYITLRPPVTNLYETFVFASACAVFILLVLGHFRKWNPATALAGIVGASLMMLARRYGTDGDTMPVLAAVLDSNFWLTIHVLTVTLGYAGVVAAGLVAHWHLAQIRLGVAVAQSNAAAKLVREIMMLGLLFTFVGTLLGGIWADQSWGRFWGWDPKENGALIIILWVAFQFHATPAGFFRLRGFSLASVFAIQTVLFAWFGVNLMGVGLHSYGFTEGTVYGLLAFALVELGFVGWCMSKQPVTSERH